jgi:signal transduction histidine kinase
MVSELEGFSKLPKEAASGARRLRWLSSAALALSAALLALSALAVILGLNALREGRSEVNRTTEIQRQAADLQTSLRAAETGQRGYLLTGLERYLSPYKRALVQIPRDYRDLTRSVRDPGQIRRLQSLRPLVDAKLGELAQTVRLREQGLEAALPVVRTDVGQALTERIDAVLADFAAAEQSLLTQRVEAEERIARRTTAAAGIAGLLSLLSAMLGVYLIFQQRSSEQLFQYSLSLEREVEERTARLSEANRELDAFAYTISHDLRAPLRAMHGYADALEEDEGERLSEEGRGFIRSIAAAAMRMNALIEDILAYARMAREEVAVRPQRLEAAVNRAYEDVLADEFSRSEVLIEEPMGTVMAHGPTLQQVIYNLLSNATKFVHPSQSAKVRVSSERRDDRIRLTVEDNGIGIAPEHREQIFAPFSRLHGVESYPGTGIGLAIVKRGVERMGGTCGVEVASGGGSRFWIELTQAGAPAKEQE